MRSSSLFFFLFLVFIYLIPSTTAQSPFCFKNVGNLTNNSAYLSQLDSILSSITTSTNSINYGFFNVSNQNSDTPNVMGLCRGDQRPEACRACLNTTAYDLRQVCPTQKEAIMYNDNCTLRYSNVSLLGKVVTSPSFMTFDSQNVSNQDSFNQALGDLSANLRSEAASSGSLHKFAAGETIASDLSMIYAYVQCTPDLSEEQRSDCLADIVSRMDQCCSGKRSGRIMRPSCAFEFHLTRFLDPVEPLPVPPSASPSPSGW